ncbi:MAG: hypothetical protein Q8938_06090 [Bacteroidota bacterium]|nr:hypothetical protein [Bacteroidota bacterium]MDP4253552.1 hypothetical protein [Bacteroidota bacterium]MDP4258572.1 hypothetical protein [Bacteroidota bacterium]
MRQPFSILLTLIVSSRLMAQSDCDDAAIMAMKGGWKKVPDANMHYDKNQVRINRCVDSIGKLFQSSLADLKGIDAGWYRTMSDPMVAGAPPGFNFNSLYKPWYCNIHLHKMLLSDETGTWIWVYVNTVGSLFQNQHVETGLQVNGMTICTQPLRKGSWKGYDLYFPEGPGGRAKFVLLTHRNRLPWRPVTQREYLMAWRSYVQKMKEGSTINLAAMQADDQKEIEHIQNNPNLKPEVKEIQLKAIQKREAMFAGNASGNAKLGQAFDDKIRLIDDYLAHHSESTLAQPAWVSPSAHSGFDGSFSSEELGGMLQVVPDPDYFSKDVPSYVPQLIMMEWTWDKNTPSLQFTRQLEENFPIGRLAAMVDNH